MDAAVRGLLVQVTRWAEGRLLAPPYLQDYNLDVDRLDRAVPLRVGLRGDRGEETADAAGRYLPVAGRGDPGRETLTWEQATRRFERLVVLADPGLGKTWLLHAYARRLALRGLERLNAGDPPEGLVIPIVARCDEVAATTGSSFIDAVLRVFADRHRVDAELGASLREHADRGGFTVLLDALDETTRDQFSALRRLLGSSSHQGVVSPAGEAARRRRWPGRPRRVRPSRPPAPGPPSVASGLRSPPCPQSAHKMPIPGHRWPPLDTAIFAA